MVEMEISSPTQDGTKSDQTTPPAKRKRNLPGMPDPDSEVIALSPKTLLATNRFVCEICSKGFQRDQNLQLHRRGHNLPWKLRQRTSKEVRKRVYVCPETTCVHHEPSRALGDLTGIKKHFCRKHGEKKYKCDRCSKKYAVHSDCKAHMKTCGSREYRCDCGTLFSRRDSFITHRAFCDALAQEISRPQPLVVDDSSGRDLKDGDAEPLPPPSAASSPPQPPLTPSTQVLSPVLSIQSSAGLTENQSIQLQAAAAAASSSSTSSSRGGVAPISLNASAPPSYTTFSSPAISLSLSSLFKSASQNPPRSHYAQPPALSATALLQKAAQMGATSSKSSFLQGLWLSGPTTPSDSQHLESLSLTSPTPNADCSVKLESNSLASGLGLGLPSGGGASGFTQLMISPPTTLDFLGLGMPAGEASSDGFSAFFSRLHHMPPPAAPFSPVRAAGDTWDEAQDRKPSML
ncbi:zinc finger protein ENHYDROUS-like [Salvia miltiorrhiza]|uniref:zinc finger protein ENHYDROUS-like n=1 Tax=Salvia miltiorrhiza TaxID=226208 RepID=UPI0025ACB0EC|nr:zinc finger protein ENHYDROUS-like [Salvia miltiorrhiza]